MFHSIQTRRITNIAQLQATQSYALLLYCYYNWKVVFVCLFSVYIIFSSPFQKPWNSNYLKRFQENNKLKMKTEKCRIKKEFVIFTSETNGKKMKHIFGAHSNVSLKILTIFFWRDNSIDANFHIFFFKCNTFLRFFFSQHQIKKLKMFMVFNLKQSIMRSKKQAFCVCLIFLKCNTY